MITEQLNNIEEMMMMIPTKMCRNMNQKFINMILKDVSGEIAKHHFMILKTLQEKDKFFVSEIVNMLGITKSQMTSSVDKLLKLGFVKRWTDTTDRRKIFIAITEEGSLITDKIYSLIKDRFHQDIKVLSQNELNDLEKGLKVLNKFCSLNEQ